MRAWTRAAVVAGLLLTGLVVLPGANAVAATKPVARRAAGAVPTVTAASTKVPLVTAYPRGVSHAVYLKALEKAIASGRMQKQGFKRVHGAMVASSASSGYALPAGPPPPVCTNPELIGNWPNIQDASGPCYVSSYDNYYEDSQPPQDIFPGQSAVLGATGTPTSPYAGQVVPAAWQLAWNNLFDFEPLMRSSYGQPGNAITGYQTEFGIFPGLDNTSCYGNTGPYGGGYNYGRYQNQCTIVDSAGPYYGTPAGQKVPWTMMTGAVTETGSGIPAVYNCAATCNAEWRGMELETPVMLEPSPYAGFGDTIGSDNKTVTFTDMTLSDLQITSWNWNFGDGTTSSEQDPVHTYAKGGQYTVTLTVTANGQTSTASTTVTPPGSLTVSATMSPSTIEVGSEDGTIDVTVTNPNKDPVSGVEVSSGLDPLDGSFTTDPTAQCISNCVDPLPAGATSAYTLGVSGVDQNDPTAADLVAVDADATIDGVDTSGTTNSPVITVNDALTVTSVDPTGGQIYGGDSVTVTGTGFQDLLGADTVTGVDFTDSEGGNQLAASNIDVLSPTELTVDSPDASSLVGPADTGTFDVVVSTSYAESPLSIDDEYDYGCQTETSTPIGDWQFSGCFNSPKADDYTSTTKATLDGLTVNPAGGSSVVDFDDGTGTLTVPASGNVALTVGGASTPVCNGPLNWDLTAASVSCPAPGGRVLGLAATGPVTLTPQTGGAVDGSVPVKLPGILGATAGTLKFAVSDGGGLTSASVTAPTAGSIAQLVSAKVTSMNLNIGSGVWSASGTATTSFGGTTALSSTFSYDSTGQLASGSLNLGKVDLAGAVTWTSLGLNYSSSTKLWTATPTIEDASTAGTVSFAVNDATGALTAGSISTGAVNLFGALPLGSLTLTYDSSSWTLATTADDSGDGSVSATFPVTSGQIAGATITQDGDPINLYSQLPSNAAVLAYSTAASLPVYTGPLTVDLPGATDTGTPATLTSTNDAAAKIKIGLTAQTALFGGVTLTSFSAPVTGPAGSTGTTACGSVGMNLGPQVGTGSDQIATLKGAMNFTYPTSGNVLYQMLGKLSVPTWKTGAGSLGIASLGLLQGQPTASAKLALGTGTASGTCPLAKLPTPTTLTLKTGVTVSGLLTGTEADSEFFFQGPASFAYPAVPLLPAKATGTVVVNEIGLTACANVANHAGLYGFSMTWAGVFSSYATGNCVLPTTSTGFGCLTESAAPAGLWQFSGCFSTPTTGQFSSTLPATLDGLGLTPGAGSSTLIDTGAKTATVPSGGTLSVPRGTTSATLCDGPFTWSLSAATVTCTPPASTRLFGLPVTGAVTFTPEAGGVVDGSAPVSLPGILGAPAGTLDFVVSGAGVLTSATVVPSGSASIAGLVTAKVTSMTLNATTGLWTVAGTVTTSAGATTTLKATVNYDASGNVSAGTLNLGKVDLGGAVTWNSLTLTYSTTTKLWTGSPVIVGAAAAGSMSLNVVDTTGAVTAGSLTTGPVSLFGALPLGSLALTSAGTSWHLTSTPTGTGLGSVSASFPVTAGQLTGATITQSANPIDLYGQLPTSSDVLAYSVVAGAPVYNGTLTVALPGATSTATPATLEATGDGPAAVKVATTSPESLFGGVDLTSISGTVKAKTGTVGTSVCGPTSLTVGPPTATGQVATLKGGALSFTYPTSGAVSYLVNGKLAIPAYKTGAGSLGIASIALVQGQATGAVTLALGTGTASPACPLAALPAPTALTLKKGVTVNGKLTGTEGSSAFFLKGTGTFAYPAATVLPASASGTITVDANGIAACAAVTGQTGKYGFSMNWAGVFTTFNTGNCVLPTS